MNIFVFVKKSWRSIDSLTLSFPPIRTEALKTVILLKYVVNGKGHPYMYVSLNHFLPFAKILHVI